MTKLRVDIWSDVVGPRCAIGKRRFEAALARFPHKDEVEVVWRAFELDPSAPSVQPSDSATRLARKYGRTREQAVAMMQQVAETARREGLDFDLVNARLGNTFDAHRVLHLAAEHGLQNAVHGVPFFVLGGAVGVSGAQPPEVFLGALEQAWGLSATKSETADGAVCGPDGCD